MSLSLILYLSLSTSHSLPLTLYLLFSTLIVDVSFSSLTLYLSLFPSHSFPPHLQVTGLRIIARDYDFLSESPFSPDDIISLTPLVRNCPSVLLHNQSSNLLSSVIQHIYYLFCLCSIFFLYLIFLHYFSFFFILNYLKLSYLIIVENM